MKTPLQRIRFGAISLGTIFLSAVLAFRFLAGYDWIEAIWMVVITISTVGYSESTDSSVVTQVLMISVILLGVSFSFYTCGGFLQLLLEGEVEKAFGERKMTMELERLSNHVIICGYGRLGEDLAKQLQHRNIPLVIVDSSEERIEAARRSGMTAILGDATSDGTLLEARMNRARAIATALPGDAANVFITLTARELFPQIQIIAKSERESSCRKLRQAGANKIVMPHRIGAQQMERMISRPHTADMVELFAEASNLAMEFDEFEIKADSALAGLRLSECHLKDQYNLLVVGMRGPDGEFRFNPQPTDTIREKDTIVVMGEVKDIKRMKEEMVGN